MFACNDGCLGRIGLLLHAGWWGCLQGGAADTSVGVIAFNNCNLTGNGARFGGAISVGSGSQFSTNMSTFTANQAQTYGGAIDASGSRYVMLSQ